MQGASQLSSCQNLTPTPCLASATDPIIQIRAEAEKSTETDETERR